MITIAFRPLLGSGALLLLAACSSSLPPAPLPTAQPPASLAGPDMMEPVVVAADARTLRERLVQAGREQSDAAEQREDAVRARQRAGALLDIRKSELETTKRAIDLARREQREGERVILESRRAALELRIDMMEERRALYDDQVELAEAEREAARARARAVEQEQAYAARLEDWRLRAMRDSALNADIPSDDVLRDARRVLDARRTVAEREGRVADRRREMLERQKKLLDAQARVGALQR